jgi:zinc transport system substrate-binding protein
LYFQLEFPMRRSYLFILPCLTLLPVAFFGCGPTPNFWVEAKPNQKKILVSFAPLYAITHAVAGEDAYVLSMLTAQGPHDYDGAPTDLFKVNKADLFIFNGLTLDDQFVDKMMRNHKNDALRTLNVGQILEKKHRDLLLHGGQEHDHGDGVKHKHGDHDPHLWLGPQQAIEMTKIIATKLAEIDPTNEKGYQARADKFIEELKKLEADGKAAFKDKKNKKIITMHEAFGYFADAFGLDIVEAIQKKPGMDPDAVSISKLIRLCRQKDGPRVIAVEPQYSKAQAEALQRTLKDDGIHVVIVTLDPLETAEIPPGKKFNPDPDYYLKEMRKNIDTLAKALP